MQSATDQATYTLLIYVHQSGFVRLKRQSGPLAPLDSGKVFPNFGEAIALFEILGLSECAATLRETSRPTNIGAIEEVGPVQVQMNERVEQLLGFGVDGRRIR